MFPPILIQCEFDSSHIPTNKLVEYWSVLVFFCGFCRMRTFCTIELRTIWGKRIVAAGITISGSRLLFGPENTGININNLGKLGTMYQRLNSLITLYRPRLMQINVFACKIRLNNIISMNDVIIFISVIKINLLHSFNFHYEKCWTIKSNQKNNDSILKWKNSWTLFIPGLLNSNVYSSY